MTTKSGPARSLRLLLALPALALLSVISAAAAKPGKGEMRELKREEKTDGKDSRAGAAEARALERLREKLSVADDQEWQVISERVLKVEEMRRTLWTSANTPRGAAALSDRPKRSGSSSQQEQDALRSALRDNLPDAEIKSRLARAHEVFQRNEARLAQAQGELRAVLTVRQEAIAVMAGLLPP